MFTDYISSAIISLGGIFTEQVLIAIVTIIIAPFLGGLLTGVDRVITARMQGRVGPPLLQPFYDLQKLIGKERVAVNSTQMAFVLTSLLFAVAALLILAYGGDLLIFIFVLAFSNIALVMGATSVRSPYSKVGAQREIIQILAYEPVLILVAIGFYLANDTFMTHEILGGSYNLVTKLPLVFLAFLYILTIKLRKSPFDLSTSHHGHQELIKGITTEFSGLQLAIIELTHWVELVIFMWLIVLFFGQTLWVGIVVAVLAFILEMLIDNMTARTDWKFMVIATWLVALSAALTNIIWLYLK